MAKKTKSVDGEPGDKSKASVASPILIGKHLSETLPGDAKFNTPRTAAASEQVRTRHERADDLNRAVSSMLRGVGWSFLPSFLRIRWQMAILRRSGLFDAQWYSTHYEDVKKSGINPMRHYIKYGVREGRAPNLQLLV